MSQIKRIDIMQFKNLFIISMEGNVSVSIVEGKSSRTHDMFYATFETIELFPLFQKKQTKHYRVLSSLIDQTMRFRQKKYVYYNVAY